MAFFQMSGELSTDFLMISHSLSDSFEESNRLKDRLCIQLGFIVPKLCTKFKVQTPMMTKTQAFKQFVFAILQNV